MQNSVLQRVPEYDTMDRGERGQEALFRLSKADLAQMERQLIPLLNTLRRLQGKRPVIVPAEKRTHE